MTTNEINPTLPLAWLGYAGFSARGPVVRVCAWCPDTLEAHNLAFKAGHEITHTICPQCYATMNESRYP